MRAKLARDAGRRALVVGDVVQSVVVSGDDFGPGPWPMLLPDRPPVRSLILGLGGGTVVHLLTHRYGPRPIVGVEVDPAVVGLGREHFGLALEHLDIVVADAITLVPALAATAPGRFDYILVDLYRGGEIVRESLSRPFLRAVHQLLEPGGTAVFNLFHDRRQASRLHRIGQLLTITRTIPVNLNLVVHCTRGGGDGTPT